MLRSLVLLLACLAAFAGAITLGATDLRSEASRREPDVVALPASQVARVGAVGFRELMADVYFMRAQQYFGNPWNNPDNYRYLYPLVDLVTDLDPQFREPLLWGAIAIQKNLGRETWVNTAESTRLLQKGTRLFASDWRFNFFLGYNLATFDHDYRGAAKALEKTLGLDGTPAYVPALITRLYSTAGDLDAAAALAQGVLDASNDPQVKEKMEARLLEIQTEMILRHIDAGVRGFHEKFGRWPGSIPEVVSSGLLPPVPPEPHGGTWLIDEGTHTARSSAESERLRVFSPERGEAKGEAHAKEIE